MFLDKHVRVRAIDAVESIKSNHMGAHTYLGILFHYLATSRNEIAKKLSSALGADGAPPALRVGTWLVFNLSLGIFGEFEEFP